MLVRLGLDDDRDKSFDCGNNDLNDFFFTDSRVACKELVSVTYAFIEDDKTYAFFSISNDSVKRELLTGSAYRRVAQKVPRGKQYSGLPAVKIGRLGVSSDWHKQGIGTTILSFIKAWFTDGNNKTGCRFILVDAINDVCAIEFYKKNGFIFLSSKDEGDKTRLMFFDLVTFKPDNLNP